MSVANASLVTDALVGTSAVADAAVDRLAASSRWHAPHLLPAEALSAVRGLRHAGKVTEPIAAAAQDRLRRKRLALRPFAPFSDRVWALRANATPYDAWYLALAGTLGTTLVTTGRKLAEVPGARCDVEVIRTTG